MISLSAAVMLLAALAGFCLAARAVAQACFPPQADSAATRLAVYWSVVCLALCIGVPAIDGFRASVAGAAGEVVLLLGAAAAAWRLERWWRDAAMEREASRLRADTASQADEAPRPNDTSQPLDVATLCAAAARRYDLTRREEDVLRLLVEGNTAAQITEALVVSPNTTKTHLRNLYRKLGINRRADLATRLGLPQG
ncbi:MAG: helix-turn-helix transcriptional regulator [Adlercreutzia sp.]|uniref:helix-turn-helix transcriptional regulator n=1 Tax=uncultured Adlercreutzia sp. TaxID=875803 RepID=UPI0021701CFD|nr:helix-turn-helix transcriptional regulator [uncultured Adlercreutzia sp.]MCI8424105.1 helix-turn-helix transcriptional regulator [Adlercreutzia sp.]